MILLLSVVSGVFGASVAVDLVDSSAKLDNVTDVDNSTSKSLLNVSESISVLKVRDADVILIISHSLFTVPIMVVRPFLLANTGC